MSQPGGYAHRAQQRADLLRFAAGSVHDDGFAWLDASGGIDPDRPVELWITCRMTHVMSLGALAGERPAPGGPDVDQLRALAAHGVEALATSLVDREHGGWYASVGPDGRLDDAKQAYGHAFVCLAASSAVAAGVPGARELLAEALDVHETRFWDDEEGLVVEEWDAGWTSLSAYRGVNANMHTVEAYLAVADVLEDDLWRERAGRTCQRVVAWAAGSDWRIPEHFDARWRPRPELNRDRPADPFRPYGATVGHGLEWARLLVAAHESLGAAAPPGLMSAAEALAQRAVADGWAADGADGFVYTTDWDGRPVVTERMHWVLAEAVNTAVVLARATGAEHYDRLARSWWDYAERHLIDHERGSWHHELDRRNRVSATVWPGKPDVYHAYQAALLPDLPTTPSFAVALRRRAEAPA